MWIEVLGYAASLIILISLLMSSVKRLRWINLVGAVAFAIYGFVLKAIPVGVMNSGIVLINVYYLYNMYSKKDYFSLLEVKDITYFNHFMSAYEKDIKKFIYMDEDLNHESTIKCFILRNTVPAGLIVAKPYHNHTLEILVDYVTPAFRDFKMGSFLYENQKSYFLDKGYHQLITKPGSFRHQKYLKHMGFVEVRIKQEIYFQKNIK